MEEVGFLVKKEEDEGGEVIVVVVRMEEEMEGRMVEELVEEMVVKMEGGQPKEGTASGCAAVGLLLEKKEEKKMKERGVGVFI